MAKGFGPPLLELGARISAGGTRWPALLHDRHLWDAVHEEAVKSQGPPQAQADAGQGSSSSTARVHQTREGGQWHALLLCRQMHLRHQDGYNGTSCGLNAQLHAPRYGLLSIKHTLRALREGYYQCDLDIGEQFLNYKLHQLLRELSGVDVRKVRSRDPDNGAWEATRAGNWERWERNWMGLQDFPYRSLQWQTRLKLEVYGNRRALDNLFHWDRVVFNLPGSKGYRVDLPWVIKIRWGGEQAAEVFVYVNDGRPTGPTEFLSWQAGQAYGAGCTYQERSAGCLEEEDIPLTDARTLGRHSDPHGWR